MARDPLFYPRSSTFFPPDGSARAIIWRANFLRFPPEYSPLMLHQTLRVSSVDFATYLITKLTNLSQNLHSRNYAIMDIVEASCRLILYFKRLHDLTAQSK